MADEIIVSEMGHMGSLAAAVTFLFAQAAGLPDPGSVDIYGVLEGNVHDEVSMQFAPEAASYDALTLWALQFGGVIQSSTLTHEDIEQQYVSVRFPFGDVLSVLAFALIPLPEPEATASAEHASESQTATPF